MNTYQKGSQFEDRVFLALDRELRNERLGVLPNSCQIYKKKGYYSPDRGSNIIVDISIEVTLPDADHWSILWVCECKDYKGAIPVNDVEEFHTKIRQIAGDNVKGLFITSGSLQIGAYNFAKAKGIGVVRLLPDDQIERILSHTLYSMLPNREIDFFDEPLDSFEFSQALTVSSFRSKGRDFYAAADGYIFGDWYSLVSHMVETIGE